MSSCVAFELVALVLIMVSFVSRAVRSFSITRALSDSNGCARSRNVPRVGLICALIFFAISFARGILKFFLSDG